MSDEMPAQFAGAEWNFRFGLLYFVFAEEIQAQSRCRRHDLRRLAFGHRQQNDGNRLTPGAFTCRANPLLDFFEVLGQIHRVIVNRKS